MQIFPFHLNVHLSKELRLMAISPHIAKYFLTASARMRADTRQEELGRKATRKKGKSRFWLVTDM